MRRLACSMTARTYILVPVSVIVSMKSAANSASACERRNCDQVVAARSGAGSTPAVRRISHTGWVEPDPLLAELAVQHRELVAQREDLRVLVPVAAWQQPQQCQRVGDAQGRARVYGR
jgi:hypothetical protein